MGDLSRGRAWEDACAPLFEDVFEPGEEPGEGGQNEGVQRRQWPEAGRLVVGLRAQVGQEAGEGLSREWRWFIHVSYI